MIEYRWPNLKDELDVIASDELARVLALWPKRGGQPVWTAPERWILRHYLDSELATNGMLSVEKAREAGQSLGRERAEARKVLAILEPTREADERWADAATVRRQLESILR